jgi:membrane fusion protein, multidrug efflux system
MDSASRISSRHLMLAVSYAMVLASSFTLTGCKQEPGTKAPSPVTVEVAAVVPKPIRLSDEFNGRVASIKSVEVRARVTGYADKVAYREGDSVKQGDLLFIIDPRPCRDALESANASLERQRAAAAFAGIQSKRAQLKDEDAYAESHSNSALSAVLLYKSLAGGWPQRPPHPPKGVNP